MHPPPPLAAVAGGDDDELDNEFSFSAHFPPLDPLFELDEYDDEEEELGLIFPLKRYHSLPMTMTWIC